jgi:hypothetical protein
MGGWERERGRDKKRGKRGGKKNISFFFLLFFQK